MKLVRRTRSYLIAVCLALLAAAPVAWGQAHNSTGIAAPVSASTVSSDSSSTRYRTIKIDGLDLFYREAGPADAPIVLLLHGFPASSFMYRDLITRLADRYRVIAPDYPGFGYSAAPSTENYQYTFDQLAGVIAKFADQLGLKRYSIYMQDFGGPVGYRLATRHPEKVSAFIVQNANAYEEGLPEEFWAPVRALWKDPSPAKLKAIREAAISDAALEWNYTHGVPDSSRVNPDNWVLQRALVNRPGNKDVMLALLYDYRTNLDLYARWHEYFRKHQPPMLIVWGRNDVIFPASGARAYLNDLPQAELHLLDTGHFALEDRGEEIAQLMRNFLHRKLPRQ
jgi:pimeloyl-ACP methyl ester carboxylesterase